MAEVGVDEAGKGPVLGSMFAAAIRVPDGADLPDGLVDSKTLPPARREALDASVRATDGIAVSIAEIPVSRIDDPGIDMNTLTVAGHAEALTGVARAGDRVRCDAADVDADRFARRVSNTIDGAVAGTLGVEAEHRADARYPAVSAAGIVAKVARDAHVAELASAYGPVGSGYPSDPRSIAFLEAYIERHGRLPDCARASWATSERILANVGQTSLRDIG